MRYRLRDSNMPSMLFAPFMQANNADRESAESYALSFHYGPLSWGGHFLPHESEKKKIVWNVLTQLKARGGILGGFHIH